MSVVCATNPTQQQTPTVISPTVCVSISFSILFVCLTLTLFIPLSYITHYYWYCCINLSAVKLQTNNTENAAGHQTGRS